MIDPTEKITTYEPGTMKQMIIDLQRSRELGDLIIRYAEARQPIPIKLINEYNELTRVEVVDEIHSIPGR